MCTPSLAHLLMLDSLVDLINTPLQRGARTQRKRANRFSGFSSARGLHVIGETAEAVKVATVSPNTPMNGSVNEISEKM